MEDVEVVKRRGPFDLESSAQRLFREDRERRKQFEELSRPFGDLASRKLIKMAHENALPTRKFASFLGGDTFRTLREAAEQTQMFSEAIRGIISPASVTAMQQTALAISRGIPDFQNRADHLASMLGPAFATASSALAAQSEAIAGAIGSGIGHREVAALSAAAEAMRPAMAAIARSADVLRMVDMATLRASVDVQDTVELKLEVFAEETAAADEALANLAESENPQESLRYLAAFVQSLNRIFDRLGRRSVREITEAGLVTWFMIAVTLLDAFGPNEPVELGEPDGAVLEEVRSGISGLREQLFEFEQMVVAADERFLVGLPRAEVRLGANVRVRPDGSSQRMYRLSGGETVAIASRDGRWRLVVFRDRLTGQLSRGWVYQSSLSDL